MDSLTSKKSLRAIRDALKALPNGSEALSKAYDRAIERIEGQVEDDRNFAKQVITWVSIARRPLSVHELLHALAIIPGESSFDCTNISSVEEITSVCLGLVVIDEETHKVFFVHYSTQQYFESVQKSWLLEGMIRFSCTICACCDKALCETVLLNSLITRLIKSVK